jgi:hypothetical protein
MKKRHLFISAFIVLSPLYIRAQVIDNALSFKNINSDKYFRINYDNDFFSGTDEYYTQGFSFELVAPWVKKFPLSSLLIQPRSGYKRYGIAFEHNGYTPSNISTPWILRGDRPFAACWMFKTFIIATDTVHRQRYSTSFSAGAIGWTALGAEMQTAIHSAFNNITPYGWPNQIQNDVVLNYQVDYERQLISYKQLFSLSTDISGRIGTLSDKAGAGLTIMAGHFDSPFMNTLATKKNFRIYVYEHARVNIIGYDATLQGGMFNKSSPYTVPDSDISRLTYENRFGLVIIYHRLYLEYFQSLLSKEFSTGNYHVWGGVQVACGL